MSGGLSGGRANPTNLTASVDPGLADFTDGTWDDETNPKFADGSAAAIAAGGYWTGSQHHGGRRGGIEGDCAGGYLRAGESHVNIGKLNDATLNPLGVPRGDNSCGHARPNSELKPLYAMSDSLFVVDAVPGVTISNASAAEGAAITFTVTLPDGYTNSAGVSVPYTLTDGRGVTGDPAYVVADSNDYTNTAGSVTIPANDTSAMFSVATAQDSTYESDHYFTVTLGTPTSTGTPPPLDATNFSAIGIIEDDADKPTIQFNPATAGANEQTGAATLTVTRTGTTLVPASVTWTTADGTASHPGDYTSATGTVRFAASDTSKTITVDITADSTAESAETFSVTLSDPVDARLGSAATATVTVTDAGTGPLPTVDVTLSASGGVAGEGVAGPTLTVAISRALTAGETVTVPLTFEGATVADDYRLVDAVTASGVSLVDSGGTHTAQNPAVLFTGSGTTAPLRIDFSENDDRTQPYLVVDYGTADRAPSGGGVTVGTLAGGPVGIVLQDNETGDIEVPSDWPLAPSGLSGGDDFRLLFRTSTGRDAASSDIADYDAFIHEVLATGGHADILPYAGFFKVLGSTRSGSGSSGATARFHNGLVTSGEHNDHHDQAGDGWADGSARSTRGTVATPVYWLNGAIIANNYADLCDISWTGSGAGVTNGFDQNDPRSEDGTQNIPDGNVTNSQRYEPWTGSGNACEAWNHPLGASTVSRGGHSGANNLLHAAAAANTQERPLLGLSPVFKLAAQAALPQLSFARATNQVNEDAGTVSVTVNADPAPSANLTVSYTVQDLEATSGDDFTAPSGSFTIDAGATSGTIVIAITDDDVFEKPEALRLTLTASSGYTVDAPRGNTTVSISDNDRAELTLGQASYTVLESGGTVAVIVDLSETAPDAVNVRLTLADGTATGSSGGAGADFDSDVLTATIAAGSDTATFSIAITGDGAAEADETFTATLSKGSGGVTANTDIGSPHVATVTIADDDHAQGLLFAPPAAGLTLDEGATATYTVRPATAPTGTVTVTITGAGSGINVDTDPSMASDQNTLTFTTSDWYIAQEVTVSAGQDLNAANEMVTLTHAPTGGGYSSSHNADFVVTADDDETQGTVSVVESDGGTSVSEDGTSTTDTYTIELDTAPAGNVVITATAGAGAQVSSDGTNFGSTATLTFTPSDHTAKTITVRGVNDDIDNAGDARTVSITHAITTGDGGGYPTTLTVDPVSVTVTDDDTAGVTVTQSGGNTAVAEDGGTDTYTVALDTQPLSNAVVTLTSGTPGAALLSGGGQTDQATVTLTFTPSAWGAQTVTVRGVNDDIDNENDRRDVTITQAVTTGDTNGKYTTSTSVANVSVRVNDDDTAAVTITGGPLTVNEDQSDTGTYTVALATQPIANITVTATAPAGARVSDDGGSTWGTSVDLVFTSGTSGNWGTAQTVTVRGHQDIIDNPGNQRAVTITHAITSGNGDGIRYTPSTPTIRNVPVTVTDDDAAPSSVALSVDDSSVGEGDGATTITVTATVGGSTRWGAPQTVAVSVAGSGGQGVVGFTAQPATFSISIAAGARTGTGMFTLTPTDDSTVENAETVTVSGTHGSATVSPATITLTDDDTAPAAPVTVTLGASDGDSDGNAVEGASGATGYRTVTITLGRALTGSETVTVPLTVAGATVATDYTFALQPSQQSGVTLVTSNPHSAQDPAVRFAAGASSATLRLTPVDNGARTQPYVVIAHGAGAAAGGGATLGTVSGGPVGVVLVDDETGDVTVPAGWGLKPSALGAGDDFRLLFRTSTTRDATSTDIADYDAFIRDVAATMGHADILAYAGFFRVFASTRGSSGSTGTTARVHTGMAAEHTSHVPSGGWSDGSAASSVGDAGVGTPIYWLNGEILANNYADLCDQALRSGGGVTTGWDLADPRSEDGTQNNPNSPGQAQQAWTGTGNACEAYDYPLGNSPDVSRGASHETTWAFLHQAHSPRAQQRPLYGMSPVFKVAGAAATPVASFHGASSTLGEASGTTNVRLNLSPAPAAGITVSYTLSGSASRGSDYTIAGVGSNNGTVAVSANQSIVNIPVAITDDSAQEGSETIVLTLNPGSGYTLTGSTNRVHTRTVTDDDTGGGTPIASFAAASSRVGEASGTTSLVVNFSPVPSSAITLKYELSGTAALGADYTISGGSGTSRTLSVSAGTTSVNIPIAITNDSAQESGETVIVTLLSSIQYARNEPLIHTRTITDDDTTNPPPPPPPPPPGPSGPPPAAPEPEPEPGPVIEPETFEDFEEVSAALRAEMDHAHAKGWLNGVGCDAGMLCPGDAMLRWQVAVMIVRAVDGAEPDPVTRTRFADVDPTAWWAAHVQRLSRLRITYGCAADRFCPEAPITRAEAASLLARAYGLTAPTPVAFSDLDPDSVHADAVAALPLLRRHLRLRRGAQPLLPLSAADPRAGRQPARAGRAHRHRPRRRADPARGAVAQSHGRPRSRRGRSGRIHHLGQPGARLGRGRALHAHPERRRRSHRRNRRQDRPDQPRPHPGAHRHPQRRHRRTRHRADPHPRTGRRLPHSLPRSHGNHRRQRLTTLLGPATPPPPSLRY